MTMKDSIQDQLCFYRTIFHKSVDTILVLDCSGTVVEVNDTACSFLGLTRERMLGKKIHENDSGILQEITPEKINDIKERGMLVYEVFHKGPDNEIVPVEVNARTIDLCGDTSLLILVRDITEQLKSEQQLMMAHAELEKSNLEVINMFSELKSTQSKMLHSEKMASIGQLAAGVAHEINNPMGFITSNLGSLEKYISKILTYMSSLEKTLASHEDSTVCEECSELKHQLKIDYIRQDIGDLIKESLDGANRVKKIVQNLKSFSRVDEVKMQEADINDCLETTLNIVWNELKYKAEVKKEYGETPLIKCYPQELNQVFVNLLINAAHAIRERGVIGIRTFVEDSLIKISISDTGIGIPEENLSRLFEPFFTTKEVGKGTGLGLSISYDIVKKHKGEILVESEEGKGSIFTVCLPICGENMV